MTKGKTGTKKATPARPAAAKSPAKGASKPSKAAGKPSEKTPAKSPEKPASKPAEKAPIRPAPQSPAKTPAKTPEKTPASSTSKTPAKSAPKSAPKPTAKPAGRAAPDPAAKPAPRPAVVPAPMKVAKKIEAPKPFQREYRRWLERLISLRHQLVADGERLGEEGLKALEQEVSVDHMADYGSDSYEQDTTLSLIENKSEALRDVDEAIKRIELKTYGLCEECEQMIPHGRLEVLPHARYCVKCQAAREGSF